MLAERRARRRDEQPAFSLDPVPSPRAERAARERLSDSPRRVEGRLGRSAAMGASASVPSTPSRLAHRRTQSSVETGSRGTPKGLGVSGAGLLTGSPSRAAMSRSAAAGSVMLGTPRQRKSSLRASSTDGEEGEDEAEGTPRPIPRRSAVGRSPLVSEAGTPRAPAGRVPRLELREATPTARADKVADVFRSPAFSSTSGSDREHAYRSGTSISGGSASESEAEDAVARERADGTRSEAEKRKLLQRVSPDPLCTASKHYADWSFLLRRAGDAQRRRARGPFPADGPHAVAPASSIALLTVCNAYRLSARIAFAGTA